MRMREFTCEFTHVNVYCLWVIRNYTGDQNTQHSTLHHTVTQYNTVQHSTTHCTIQINLQNDYTGDPKNDTYAVPLHRRAKVCLCVLQCVAMCYDWLQCIAVCCNVLQCVAVCCSVLQCA